MAPAFAAVRLWTSGRVWSLQQSLLGRGRGVAQRVLLPAPRVIIPAGQARPDGLPRL
jgi:hypothetical protein